MIRVNARWPWHRTGPPPFHPTRGGWVMLWCVSPVLVRVMSRVMGKELTEKQRAALNRLKTVRGHLDGIIRMLESDAYCVDASPVSMPWRGLAAAWTRRAQRQQVGGNPSALGRDRNHCRAFTSSPQTRQNPRSRGAEGLESSLAPWFLSDHLPPWLFPHVASYEDGSTSFIGGSHHAPSAADPLMRQAIVRFGGRSPIATASHPALGGYLVVGPGWTWGIGTTVFCIRPITPRPPSPATNNT